MLTIDKVLNVFGDYLQQDPLYEVVLTGHGYTLMAWEPERDEWYQAELMETPEMLLEALLDAYAGFLEDQITENDRELNPSEEAEIKTRCKILQEQCQSS